MKVDLNEIRTRRGIYLLPNLLTTMCLFGGFYSIIAAIDGNFERAAIAIFGAMIFAGLEISVVFAVIGAVVGEFVGADRGLGFLISAARGQFDTALVFVAVFALVAMAMTLYGCVAVLERVLLKWKE